MSVLFGHMFLCYDLCEHKAFMFIIYAMCLYTVYPCPCYLIMSLFFLKIKALHVISVLRQFVIVNTLILVL